jgi:hypothetical protein
VTAVPREVSEATVEAELEPARGWAARAGLPLDYDESELRMTLRLTGPPADPDGELEPYLLEGVLDSYPAIPPAWRFIDPESGGRVGASAFPEPASPHPRGSALIINSGMEGVVICAHFNRLAFSELGGPHGDWGPLAAWKNPPSSAYTHAVTIADMLARIALEVADSRGRKAPRP